jgi:hypothetical protein
MSRAAASYFRQRLIRTIPPSRPYPLLVVYAVTEAPWAVCIRDNPSSPLEASYHRWCVPTRGEHGLEGMIGAPTSKGAGYGSFSRNPPYGIFGRRPIEYRGRPTVPLLSSRLYASLQLWNSTPLDGNARPHERRSTSSERPSMALLPGCPHPTPTPASHL